MKRTMKFLRWLGMSFLFLVLWYREQKMAKLNAYEKKV